MYSIGKAMLLPLLFFIIYPAVCSYARNTVYPADYQITSEYEINSTVLDIDDTMTISRKIINNEPFPLTGLYFSENLPQDFEIISWSVSLNEAILDNIRQESFTNFIFPEYKTCTWIIDDPVSSDYQLDTNDSIFIDINVVCHMSGLYTLPLHSASFYGDAIAFFTTGEQITINFGQIEVDSCCVGIRGNVNDDPDEFINISDITYLVGYLFNNPPGPAPPCLHEANVDGDINEKVNISDITYLVAYLFGNPPGPSPDSCPY